MRMRGWRRDSDDHQTPRPDRGVSFDVQGESCVEQTAATAMRSFLSDGHYLRGLGMKLRLVLALVCAITGLAVTHLNAKADDPLADGGSNDPRQRATTWSKELAGGQWGWRITEYKIFEAIYSIDGQTVVLLSKEKDSADSLLWNPMTGTARHFDHAEFAKFQSDHARDLLSSYIFPNQGQFRRFSVPLLNGRLLQSFRSPGQPYSCHAILFQYYETSAYHSNQKSMFYIVRTLKRPELVKYFTCREAEVAKEHRMTVDFVMDFNVAAELPDRTLLFFSMGDADELIIIRLDQTLSQRSSLGGRVCVVDAEAINNDLTSESDDFGMYTSFREIFMKKLASSTNLECRGLR
jgi:hypothetical protein